MLWFVLPALAAPVCVAPVPERPRPAVPAVYDPDAPPTVLVPLAWHRTGNVGRGRYHDDRGRAYRFRDVEAALLDNPHSQPAVTVYRRELAPKQLDPLMPKVERWRVPDRWEQELVERGLLSAADEDAGGELARAVCLFNASQGELLAAAAARAEQLAAAARVRTSEDPPMAVWGIAATLYEAMGARPPADPAAWRADVGAVAEALAGGVSVEALAERVQRGEGALAERVLGD